MIAIEFELQTTIKNLPDTLEDLTQFVLVGKAKLQAYMLKLRTVNKLSTAQEIRAQTLEEAQEISTALIAAEQRIGELLLAIPTAQGKRNDIETSVQRGTEVKTKAEVISQMGYGEKEYREYQQMAKNPEIVQQVIENALANGEVVTKTAVLKEIKAAREEAKKEALEAAEKENADLRRENAELLTEIEGMKTENIVEVVPDDYKYLKKRNAEYCQEVDELNKKHREELQAMQKENDALRAEKEAILKESEEPATRYNTKVRSDCIRVTHRIVEFLEQNGGYTYIKSELSRASENEQKSYISALRKLYEWCENMLEITTMGGVEV